MPRQILSNFVPCSRCGLQNSAGSTHCAACGNPIGDPTSASLSAPPLQRAVTAIAVSASAAPIVTPPSVRRRTPAELFGWRRLDGTVIHESPQYLGHLQREWWEILLRIAIITVLVIAFGITALAILIGLAVFALLSSLLFSSGNPKRRQGFVSTLATQLASFFLISRIFGPKRTIPVREYRLRDNSGVESLVRVEGYVQHGAMTVGDDVTAEGFIRRGTLLFRRGWNKRLKCAVDVKRR